MAKVHNNHHPLRSLSALALGFFFFSMEEIACVRLRIWGKVRDLKKGSSSALGGESGER